MSREEGSTFTGCGVVAVNGFRLREGSEGEELLLLVRLAKRPMCCSDTRQLYLAQILAIHRVKTHRAMRVFQILQHQLAAGVYSLIQRILRFRNNFFPVRLL